MDKAGFMEMAKQIVGDDKSLIALAQELIDECEAEINGVSDRCESGMQFEICMHKGVKSRNLDIDLF